MISKAWFLGLLCLCAAVVPAFAADYGGFVDHEYVARSGDFNGDGRTDLFLKYRPKIIPIPLDDLTIPIPVRQDVNDFVLQQRVDGGFDVVSNLSQSQREMVQGWAVVILEMIRGDFNLDGLVDILIKNVGSIIPNALDTLVFAPPARAAPPAAVKGIDSAFKQFARDVTGWIENPDDYYTPGYYYTCQVGYAYVPVLYVDELGNYYYVYEWRLVQVCGWAFDPTNYSIPAIELLNALVEPLTQRKLAAQTNDAISVSQKLEALLGVPVMKGALETGSVDTGRSSLMQEVILEGGPYRPDIEGGENIARLIVGIFRKLFVEYGEGGCGEETPPQTPHYYETKPQNNIVCTIGSPGCTTTNVYNREQLVHPVVGYWDRSHDDPVQDFEPGYATMGCTLKVLRACDPAGMFDGGPIYFRVYPNELKHENITVSPHVFHQGKITRQTIQEGNVIRIKTVGEGTGACPRLNETQGEAIFNTLDAFIRCHLGGYCQLGN